YALNTFGARASILSPGKFSGDQTGIVAAKTKRVIDGGVDFNLASSMRHVVEIAFGVGEIEIDGGRHGLFFDGLDANGHLDGAGRSEHVSGGAFGGTDGHMAGMFAKNSLDGLGFAHITLRCGGAVGADI